MPQRIKKWIAVQLEERSHYTTLKKSDVTYGCFSNSTIIEHVSKDYYIDGQNTQLISFQKMSTGGVK